MQLVGLVLLPLSMMLELSGALGRDSGVADMLLMLAFGAVAPTPIMGTDATGALDGTRDWSAAADEALASILSATRPIDDVRGGREYRAAMLPVLSKRAWQAARERLARASHGPGND